MRARRRGNRNCVEIVPRNQLFRVGMHVVDAHFVGDLGGLVAVASADGRHLPTLRAKRRNVDLGAKTEADNADLSIRGRHLPSPLMRGDRGTTLAEALIMTALNEQRRDRRSLVAE